MDLRTILAISGIGLAALLFFQDQIKAFLTTVKPTGAPNVKVSANPVSALVDLETLVHALDNEKDKEELDYLIDKLAPKLIRRKLGR